MDPVTHAVLGAAVGQAGYRRRLGRRALAVGAVAALLPDADIIAGWIGGPYAAWLYHRGPTHSVWFAATVGPLLGWLLWRRLGGERGAWMGLITLALLTHPLIDLVTQYGTQLLAPISDARFAIAAMPIIDPVFTLILLAAVVTGALTRRPGLSSAAAWAGLGAAYAYVLFAWSLNLAAEDAARRQLAAEGVNAEVHAYATVLQPYLRRIVARDGSEVRVGFRSWLAPGPIVWQRRLQDGGPAVAAVQATPEARIFTWFAMGQVLWQRDQDAVVASDLRYGYPGDSLFGQWGIRVPLDAAGQPAAAPERFSRGPGLSGGNLAKLWSWVFG